MAACEKCWAEAGGNVEAYHRLLESRQDHPCTPKEQAGPYWNEARQRDRRFDDMRNRKVTCPECGYEAGCGLECLTCSEVRATEDTI